MHRTQIPIAEPCHADWDAMTGDARRRFCGACTKHVHDLSAVTEPEAERLLAATPDLCVRYTLRPDGSLVHRANPTNPGNPVRRSRAARAAALGFALLGAGPAFASGAVAVEDPQSSLPP
ncbi:MAG: hypothetical protein ABMB14_28300, partial [Myxococcota bacterium]